MLHIWLGPLLSHLMLIEASSCLCAALLTHNHTSRNVVTHHDTLQNGDTPLYAASARGLRSVVKMLLGSNASADKASDVSGRLRRTASE